MDFAYPQPVDSATGRRTARYAVRGHDRNRIRAFLLHEDRRDAEGKLVEWDLVLLSPDVYVWRRSDWPLDASTNPVHRCSARAATPDQQPLWSADGDGPAARDEDPLQVGAPGQ